MRASSLVVAGVLVSFLGCTCGGAAPPSGFSQVLSTSADLEGEMPSLVLDRDGHPMVAYLRRDSASPESWSVRFTRWDAQAGAWTAPVVVAADLGVVDNNPTLQQVWLARDGKDGRLGVAFVKSEQFCGPAGGNKESTVNVAFSTDLGATWSTAERVSEAKYTRNDPVNGVEVCNTSAPRIAMRDGAVHLAWAAMAGEAESDTNYYRGYYYAKSEAGGAWARQLLPHAGDDARQGTSIVSLALDATGAPAVAYVMRAIFGHATPYMNAVVFARPGGSAVRAGDSAGVQNDEPQVALGFDGTRPRIAAHLVRASGGAGANANWVFGSEDGASFAASQVPDDGEDQGANYLDIDFAANRGVVLYDFRSTNATGAGACGGPKQARSTDGTTWTTCGLDTQTRQFLGTYVSAELTDAGKVIAVFSHGRADTASPSRFGRGLVLYVEP